jgi:hypothetical protein
MMVVAENNGAMHYYEQALTHNTDGRADSYPL